MIRFGLGIIGNVAVQTQVFQGTLVIFADFPSFQDSVIVGVHVLSRVFGLLGNRKGQVADLNGLNLHRLRIEAQGSHNIVNQVGTERKGLGSRLGRRFGIFGQDSVFFNSRPILLGSALGKTTILIYLHGLSLLIQA